MSIIWSDLAIEELNDIEDYIARDNPARAFQTAYTDKMQQLLALLQANLTDVFPKADTKEYEKKLAQLETRITTNLQRVAEKYLLLRQNQ